MTTTSYIPNGNGKTAMTLAFTLMGSIGQVANAYAPKPVAPVETQQVSQADSLTIKAIRHAMDQGNALLDMLGNFIHHWEASPVEEREAATANQDLLQLLEFIDSGGDIVISQFRGLAPEVDDLIRVVSRVQSRAEVAARLMRQRAIEPEPYKSKVDRSKLARLLRETTEATFSQLS